MKFDSWPKSRIAAPAILILATALVFGRVVGFGWTEWDDTINVTKNPGLNPITPASLWSFWRTPYEGLYIPVSYSLFAAEVAISRAMFPGPALDPRLFHALSLVLHAACVLLVWQILRSRIASGLPALAGAMIFAVHPLQVESVTWISEQRGLLSALLCFAMLCLSPDGDAPPWRRALCLTLFTLAILAKPHAVIAPLLLAVLRGKGAWRATVAAAVSVWPLLVAAAVVAMITRTQQPGAWAWGGVGVAPWLRPIVAGDAISFYAEKFLLPVGLCLDYGRIPARVVADPLLVVRAVAMFAVIMGICIVPRMRVIRVPVMLAVAGLLPVLGLVPFTFQGFSTVADRYAYLPMLGAAVGVALTASRIRPALAAAAAVGYVAWLVGLMVLTSVHLPTWRDDEALNRQIICINPRSTGGHLGLGVALSRGGRTGEALEELRAAVVANPDYFQARYELAQQLHLRGLRREAEGHYRAALTLRPTWADAHSNLGILLAQEGRLDDAIKHFRKAIALEPDHLAARMNLKRAETSAPASPAAEK
jgi:protein O-mannosyl-transferase